MARFYYLATIVLLSVVSFVNVKAGDVPYDEIHYNSWNGIIKPKASAFDAKIVSNSLVEGEGYVIKFDGPVTEVGESAFENASDLMSVSFPDCVEKFGKNAFAYCDKMTYFTFPDFAKEVSDAMFYKCSMLSNVNMKNVERIGNNAFSDCGSIKEVNIPGSVKEIGEDAFVYTNVKNVVIPEGVKKIGDKAFALCAKLESVEISSTVDSIGSSLFWNCNNLNKLTVNVNNKFFDSRNNCNAFIETATGKLVAGCKNTVFEMGIKSIGDGAFWGCEGLSNAVLPKGVKYIERNAFRECTGLNSLQIPSSVDSIARLAFYDCNRLKDVYVGWKVPYVPEADNVFNESQIGNMTLHCVDGSSELYKDAPLWRNFGDIVPDAVLGIPNNEIHYTSRDGNVVDLFDSSDCNVSVVDNTYENGKGVVRFDGDLKKIGKLLFFNVRNLTSIVMPESVTEIGDSAFAYCSNLTDIVLSDNLQSIGVGGFALSTRCKVIDLPEGLLSIGDDAFLAVSALTMIEIPASVENIGVGIFSECSNLKNIVVREGGKYNSRNNCNAIIETATGKLVAGCNYSTVPDGVTSIAARAFDGCRKMESIVLPNSVKNIGRMAFESCLNLSSITWPETMDSIAENAFSNCSQLNNVVLPEGIERIEDYTFGYTGVENIVIPNSVAYISVNAFDNCVHIQTISVKDNNSVYDSRDNCNAIIFTDNDSLVLGSFNTVIPNTVKIIGEKAFAANMHLNNMDIPNGVTSIGNEAFYYCSSLESVKIPDSVTHIGKMAFYCTGINNIEIPEGVTGIEEDVLNSCGNLESVVFKGDVKYIADMAFAFCSSLKSVTIPASVDSIGESAFWFDESLTDVYVGWLSPLVINEWVFKEVDLSNVTLHVPAATADLYNVAEVWKDFGKIVEDQPNEIADAAMAKAASKAALYNLKGQRISAPEKNEIVISGGKKMLTK